LVGGLIWLESKKKQLLIEIKLINGTKSRLRGIGDLITKAA
jgi:hypothetical protein